MMANLLFVYHYIPQYRYAIFSELRKAGCCYDLAADIKSNNDIQLVDRVHNFLPIKRLKNIWVAKHYLYQRGLISLILSGRYKKVVFLGDPHFVSTWLAISLCKLFRIKCYLWTHGFAWGNSLKDILKLVMYHLADGLLLYGNLSKDNLAKRGIPNDKLHVIYNSLNRDLIETCRQSSIQSLNNSPQLTDNTLFKIFFVGRLTAVKKIDLLLHSIKILRLNHYKVHLDIIGDGDERSTLEALVLQLGLIDCVLFRGKIYTEIELSRIIIDCDVCVSPGNVGLTAIHSMSYGKPVITHSNKLAQMPEYESVIPGVTGELFAEGCAESLASTIATVYKKGSKHYMQNCLGTIANIYNPSRQAHLITEALGCTN